MEEDYKKLTDKELKDLWQKYVDKCFAIRKELDKRAGNSIPIAHVEYTDFLTD